jgi:uncharacterized protein
VGRLFSGITAVFERFSRNRIKKNLDEVINRGFDRSVRLAVTGLSGSGKTVFITSLINQILHGVDSQQLPFFEVSATGRYQGAKIIDQLSLHVPAFRYQKSLDCLRHQPASWPSATNGISEIRLAVRFKDHSLVGRRLKRTSTLFFDIIDYPGEWLLDLPLVELSYKEWCAEVTALCQPSPRRELAEKWLAYMQNIQPDDKADDDILREAAALYTEFLYTAKRSEYGLSMLQPGRFTMPGDMQGAPVLEFCPLLNLPEDCKNFARRSVYKVMEKRFEYYKSHVIKKFYEEHFSSFDRQIVLVDVLKALNIGVSSFNDMRSSIEQVLKSFNYGKSGLFNRLFNVKIDKLLFAVTKADHVTPNQIHNLERFLQQMILESHNSISFEGVEVETMALSSVKCTQAATSRFQGQPISCIKGVPKGHDGEVALFPGEVPLDIPTEQDWVADRFNFIDFNPPALHQLQSQGLPHIRMDRALQFLLGDKF